MIQLVAHVGRLASQLRRFGWPGASLHVYVQLLLVTCGRATIARAGLVAGRTLGRAGRRVGRNDGRTGPLASRPGVRADGLVGWYVDDWPAWVLAVSCQLDRAVAGYT